MDIDQVSNKFLEALKKAELLEYCEKQHNQITLLVKDLENAKFEIEHLKKLITSSDALVIEPVSKISPEELICIEQVRMLKSASEIGILTLEESKKLDTYVKLLQIIRGKEKVESNLLKSTETGDLLRLIEDVEAK